jgi:hypothetical protein
VTDISFATILPNPIKKNKIIYIDCIEDFISGFCRHCEERSNLLVISLEFLLINYSRRLPRKPFDDLSKQTGSLPGFSRNDDMAFVHCRKRSNLLVHHCIQPLYIILKKIKKGSYKLLAAFFF